MSAAFLHGVETINVGSGPVVVQQLASAVIAIVGTAPAGPINQLTLCLSESDDLQFGEDTAGYTLPAALASLREFKVGAIMVVNVYDHTGTDPVTATNLSTIIGGTDTHGARSGLAAVVEGYGTFGFDAKILIVPGYSSAPAVGSAMETLAGKIKSVFYTDLPLGLTVAEAITSRSGSVLGLTIFQSSSDRLRPCYPHVLRFNKLTSQNVLEPCSIRAAGLRAKIDNDIGWWTSSSNKGLIGVLGLERNLLSRINDANSETNMLNAAGITTVFNAWGTGYRLWGNRNASFPTSTIPENFEQVRRTRDMIEGSLEQAALQFTDADIDQGEMDALVESGNGFMRSLYGRKAILGGLVWFDPSRTTTDEMQNGQIRVQYKFTPKYPIERLTYESEITGEYLLTLKRTTGTGGNG